MKILINGIQAGLRFSSAHLIPGHSSCGHIHGHSYFVDIEVEGECSGKFDFVVDFQDIKSFIDARCNELDHRILIPVQNNLIEFKDFKKLEDSIEKLENANTVHFKVDGKGYSLPSVDCVFLDLPYTSAEELSKYFADLLVEELSKKYDNISSISVCVNEGIGQGALYTKELVE